MRKIATQKTRNPRLRRLWSDYMSLNEMVSSTDLIKIAPAGDPPDRYRVLYRCRGLVAVAQNGDPELAEDTSATSICTATIRSVPRA